MSGENRVVYLGTYPYKVDGAGRVAVPAKWRSKDKSQNEFCILPAPKKHLLAIPRPLVNKMLEKADNIPIGAYNQLEALRTLAGRGDFTACDKQGRIVLPAHLLRYAGITDQAMLVGALNKFEIWAVDRFAESDQVAFENVLEAAKELQV